MQRGTEAFRFLVRVTKVTRWLGCVERLKVLFPLVGSFICTDWEGDKGDRLALVSLVL